MRGIERRLARLEAGRKAGRLLIIRVIGGPDADRLRATAGEREWLPAPGESAEAFTARATAEAEAAGLRWLVLGGRPR